MHYHITTGIESKLLDEIKEYLNKFESINIELQPEAPELQEKMKRLFIGLLASIKRYDKGKVQ